MDEITIGFKHWLLREEQLLDEGRLGNVARGLVAGAALGVAPYVPGDAHITRQTAEPPPIVRTVQKDLYGDATNELSGMMKNKDYPDQLRLWLQTARKKDFEDAGYKLGVGKTEEEADREARRAGMGGSTNKTFFVELSHGWIGAIYVWIQPKVVDV